MELQLKIIGVLLIVLALLHAGFPRYFNWKEELRPLSLMNRQMMIIHTFFIALVVLLMGILCLTSAGELTGTALGKRIALGFGLFWATRLVVQFFEYSPALWRGKTFETVVHVLFAVLWTYLSVVFLMIFSS